MQNGSPGVPGDWAPDRLQVYRALLAIPGFDLATWINPLLQALPWRLGESPAGATIPFAFDDDFNDLTDLALDDLVDLVYRRLQGDPKPSPGLEVEVSAGRGLRPATCSLAVFPENSPGFAVAARAVRLDPLIDSGLVEAWVTRGHGGPLFERLAALYARLREEDQRAGSLAPFLGLSLLGTGAHLESKKVRAKGLVSRVLPPEKVDKLVGSFLFALVEAALLRALHYAPAPYSLQARGLLCPLSFFSMRHRALQNDLNPWGISEAFAEAADHLWSAILQENPNPRDTEQLLARAFQEGDFSTRAAQAGAVLVTRRRALDWLALYDGHDPEVSSAIGAIARADSSLCAALSDPKAVLSRLTRFARGLKPDPAGEAATAALVDCLRGGIERPEAVREIAQAYTALALDRVAAEAIDRAKSRLMDRRGDYTREQLVADYLAGRLYRLSADGKPIRRTLARKTQGHLFIDFRDLVSRTCRVKDVAAAELLRAELYEPVLMAASKRIEGLSGEQRISLQLVHGDGAAFSGQIPALVELAQDLPRVCRSFAEKINSRAEPKDLEARRAEVESWLRGELERMRHEAAALEQQMQSRRACPVAQLEQDLFGELAGRIAALDARRHQALQANQIPEATRAEEAAAALRAREKELFSRVENLFGPARDQAVTDLVLAGSRARLRELERRAGDARRFAQGQLRTLDDESRARAPLLEVGLFVSFGANAELASMAEEHFGSVKVAVAEKSQEAARGTARNAMVRARLEALVARARAARNNPRLDLPFRVYVDSTYGLMLPTELAELVDACLRERDAARAREAARLAGETMLRDLARWMGMGDAQPPEAMSALSDLWNSGEAFSGEALAAYLTQTAPGRVFFRKLVPLDELDAEFHELFVFAQDCLELTVSLPADGDPDQAVVFHRAGAVHFRGLLSRAPTSVWELLRPDSPFMLLLAQKHLPLWAAESIGRAPGELPD